MVKKAKKEFSEYKKESAKTGGGRPPSDPPSTSSRIIEMYKDTAGFSGIPGAADLETLTFSKPAYADYFCTNNYTHRKTQGKVSIFLLYTKYTNKGYN